jgi:hypothetical protein
MRDLDVGTLPIGCDDDGFEGPCGEDRRRLHHHQARQGPVAAVLGHVRGEPAQVGFMVSYAPTEDEAAQIAHRLWVNSGLPGELAQVLPSPKHFEQAS